jgi:hypothetical protein
MASLYGFSLLLELCSCVVRERAANTVRCYSKDELLRDYPKLANL